MTMRRRLWLGVAVLGALVGLPLAAATDEADPAPGGPAWRLWVGVSRNGAPSRWRVLAKLPDAGRCEAALIAVLEARQRGHHETGSRRVELLDGHGLLLLDEASLDSLTFRFECRPGAAAPRTVIQ